MSLKSSSSISPSSEYVASAILDTREIFSRADLTIPTKIMDFDVTRGKIWCLLI